MTDAPEIDETTLRAHFPATEQRPDSGASVTRLKRKFSNSIEGKEMMKQISTALVSAVILLNALGCSNGKVRAAAPPPPPVVEVAPVVQKDVPVQGEWVGTLEGYVNAQISPQVSGYLIRQDYREGALVKKGQLLFEIDPRPFQAVLDQAKGQLAQAEARMANAEINVKRDIPEAEAHAIPQSQLDTDTQELLAAKASVEADQAAVEQASINLGYTKVKPWLYQSCFVDRRNCRNQHCTGGQLGGTVRGSHRGFAGKSDQGLFSDQRTGIPTDGRRRWTGERRLYDARFTNPVADDLGRRECLPTSRQNHLRGSPSKHADRDDSDRGRVPQCEKFVAARPVRAHSGVNRIHHRSAAGTAGGSESAARYLPGDSRQRRQSGAVPHRGGRASSGHALGDQIRAETRRTRRGGWC